MFIISRYSLFNLNLLEKALSSRLSLYDYDGDGDDDLRVNK